MMAAMVIAGWLQVGLGQQIVKIPSQNWDFRSGTLDNWHIMEWPENMKLIKDKSATGGYYYKVNNLGKGANITTPKFLVGNKAKLYARYQRSGGSSCQVEVRGADKKRIKLLADNNEAPQGGFGLKIFDLSEFEGKNVYVGINGGTVMIDYMYVEQEVLEIPKVNLESGLVAYYPFNGNANDESGNGNDGEVFGATLSLDRNGNSAHAYNFDGENDWILIPLDSDWDIGQNDFSYSYWIKTKDSHGYIFELHFWQE